ncbi:hypothetical protein D3C75_1190290 [compost metagenome]
MAIQRTPDGDDPALDAVREAVLEDIFHDRLQNHFGHLHIQRLLLRIDIKAQILFAEPLRLQDDIVLHMLDFIAERNLCAFSIH